MATTYKKTLKTITVKTLGGTTVSVSDTATSTAASNALAQFEAGQTMVIKGEEKTTYVPFHAVDSIEVTTAQSADITRPDPYGCEETEVTPEP